MKKLHLVCNAHLDPVWQWDWDEGVSATLATFYSAIDLAKDYDYIFCHNEVILYEYIERYAPQLFGHIQELVKEGKWKIIGGWYDQPDCNIPMGESFLRQITLGREYFKTKFDCEPTTALNFDSFGHTRSLPEILKKTGYDSYIFCRPLPFMMKFVNEPFIWEGYDGSKIKGLRYVDDRIYCSAPGKAKQDIIRKAKVFEDQEVGIALWGVGNHGGGASRKDLDAIKTLQEENKGKVEIVHSTLENYFAEVNPTYVYKDPFELLIKAYTSISNIKQKHAELETLLYNTEKACSLAALKGDYVLNRQAIKDAERMMCQVEFHDVLSGTCIEKGEKSALRKMEYATELLTIEFLKAFHSLAKDYKQIDSEYDPFVIFNFLPYEYETIVESEELKVGCLEKDAFKPIVYQDGKIIPSQVIKEDSHISLERRKRIAYKIKLNALGTTKVDIKYEVVKLPDKKAKAITNDYIYQDDMKTVRINHLTGLIESLVVNGKEYLSGPAFEPLMFEDNEDPWGWHLKTVGSNFKKFKLLKQTEIDNKLLTPLHVLEDGPILTEVESMLAYKHSTVTLRYKIYRNMPYIDVTANIVWNDDKHGLKFKTMTTDGKGKYYGQVAFGIQGYAKDGNEKVAQRFVTVSNKDDALSVYANGTYGYSMKGKALYMTALNGSAYCAHPVAVDGVDLPIVDGSRKIQYIEQGRHTFTYRLGVNKLEESQRFANEFVNKPYNIGMFPHGDGNVYSNQFVLDNKDVTVSAFKQLNDGAFMVRLFNNDKKPVSGLITIKGISYKYALGKYSFETYVYNGKSFVKQNRSDLY